MEPVIDYSIIQLSPTGLRGEYVNIGLVLFLKDRLDIRIMQNPSKVHALDPNFDLGDLAALPDSLSFWDSPDAPLHTRYELLARQGAIALTPPGKVVLGALSEYEARAERLMADLVLVPSRQKTNTPTSRLSSEVRQLLRSMKVLGKARSDIDRHMVVEQYPIDPEANLYAEFATRDGSFHCIETVDYRSKSAGAISKFYETGAKAFTLKIARERLGETTRAYAVFACHTEDRSKVRAEIRMLEQTADETFDLGNKRDRAGFGSRLRAVITGNRDLAQVDE